ncbi:DUF5719 family protein [Streptomyces sp. H10-C2]|uniref:DUF5719 family protein n=1 Tax=unclassified Streptomyces TaxID=2593676 RepID=UPI0024B886B2|nr:MULTISPECIES: DUF5719 family protein [unclassified Streptomyces]MDJ0341255.1 DUF5719 family protein [Streptomyces sp. PH10-H1]MDJ0370850.1 DUF5719 family protein [Streptomyces sp. H10-C2]
MNRSILSLAGATAALVALTGAAVLTGAGDPAAAPVGSAARQPVQRSALVCPAPSASELASTTYTSFTPKGTQPGRQGSAQLLPATGAAGGQAKPLAPLTEPGVPVTAKVDKPDQPALVGTAEGGLAPGWSVQQTTVISAGAGRGVLGTSCVAPDSEFWFPAASTAADRQDFLHLVNPDDMDAVVDIELFGKDGALKATTGDGVSVPSQGSTSILLSTLIAEKAPDLTVHVTVRSGRVGAAVQAADSRLGVDWLPAAADPAGGLVFPGIPSDATSVQLVAYATSQEDADLTVRLASPAGSITPAGHETLHVKSGMTTAVDLGDLTKGEAGSLLLAPTDAHSPAPIVAALRITRGTGAKQEMAFLPATAKIDDRATVADNRTKASTLSLVAPGKEATVKVTTSAATDGGAPVTKTVTVKAGTTLAIEPPQPSSGTGAYAVTVEPVSGGPVYASRMLSLPLNGVPMFTIQPMPDDRGTVVVPKVQPNLSILTD